MTDATGDLAARIDAAVDRAYRLATVILGNSLDAEDAVVDAALAAWRSRGRLRDPDRFDAWFGRIVVNACRDRLRSRRRAAVIAVTPRDIADLGNRTADVDFADRLGAADAVLRAFDGLEPEERIVVALRFWADLPIDAIAERVGVPPGTVKSRLHRALNRLRIALEEAEG